MSITLVFNIINIKLTRDIEMYPVNNSTVTQFSKSLKQGQVGITLSNILMSLCEQQNNYYVM